MIITLKKKFTLKELKNFRKISNDNNILHHNKNIGKFTPYKKPVVYAAAILKYIINKIPLSYKNIHEINAMFFKPVLLGENIIINIRCKKNKFEIIISNGFINKTSINIKFNYSKRSKNNSNISRNLENLSRLVGNFKRRLNIITFINIKSGRYKKNKFKFQRNVNNNFILTSNYKNYYNTVNFSSFPSNINKKKLNQNKIIVGKTLKIKKTKKNILIIGGSSGLGNVLSQFFFSKGLRPTITYNYNNVKNNKFFANLESFRFNENSSIQYFKKLINYEIIYFFPTPNIFSYTNKIFDYAKFRKFNDIYINFLFKIVKILISSSKKHTLFIPSTSLIHNPIENLEYALSKSSMEYLLKNLNKNCKNLKIYYPRLDAYSTDNTKFFLNINKNYDNFIKAATNFI